MRDPSWQLQLCSHARVLLVQHCFWDLGKFEERFWKNDFWHTRERGHGMEACTFCCQNQSVNHKKSLRNVERLLVKVFIRINILKMYYALESGCQTHHLVWIGYSFCKDCHWFVNQIPDSCTKMLTKGFGAGQAANDGTYFCRNRTQRFVSILFFEWRKLKIEKWPFLQDSLLAQGLTSSTWHWPIATGLDDDLDCSWM